jgi:hypothetical protein
MPCGKIPEFRRRADPASFDQSHKLCSRAFLATCIEKVNQNATTYEFLEFMQQLNGGSILPSVLPDSPPAPTKEPRQ